MPSSRATIATSVMMLKTDIAFHQMNWYLSVHVGQHDQLDLLDLRIELDFCPMCEELGIGKLR